MSRISRMSRISDEISDDQFKLEDNFASMIQNSVFLLLNQRDDKSEVLQENIVEIDVESEDKLSSMIQNSILTLPNEVLLDIMYTLPPDTLNKLCNSNTNFSNICNDPYFQDQYDSHWNIRLINKFSGNPDGGMYEAGLRGSDYLIEKFKNKGGDLNKGLLGAARGGYTELIHQLLSEGANDRHGALLEAIKSGNYGVFSIFKDLIKEMEINEQSVNEITNSLSQAPPTSGTNSIFKYILLKTPFQNMPLVELTFSKIAAMIGLVEFVDYILRNIDPSKMDIYMNQVYSMAMHNNQTELLKFLEQKGISPQVKLLIAIERGDYEYVDSILQNNPNYSTDIVTGVAAFGDIPRLDRYIHLYHPNMDQIRSLIFVLIFHYNKPENAKYIAEKYNIDFDATLIYLFGTNDIKELQTRFGHVPAQMA